MDIIKPIETIYNGYRFRSRLEVRWAVCFDAMGLRYKYEPEGFDLGDGIWYLPDFWIEIRDNYGVWIEIKPTDLINEWEIFEKPLRLHVANWLQWRDNHIDNVEKQKWSNDVYVFCGEIGNHRTFTFSRSYRYGWDYIAKKWVDVFEIHQEDLEQDFSIWERWTLSEQTIQNAFTTARQAHFEHGETPRVNGKI